MRFGQETLTLQEETDRQPPEPIPIEKRVNRLKLIVNQSEASANFWVATPSVVPENQRDG